MKDRFLSWLADKLLAIASATPYFDLEDYMLRLWLFGGSHRDERSPYDRGWLGSERDFRIGRWIASRVHQILRSDRERHMHDHPWPSITCLLRGHAIEMTPLDQRQDPILDATHYRYRLLKPGSIVFRRARTRHRLIKIDDVPAVSLFIMLPFARPTLAEKVKIQRAHAAAGVVVPELTDIKRRWGFYEDFGWSYWRGYLNEWKRETDGEKVIPW